MSNYKISGSVSESAIIRIYKQATNEYIAYKSIGSAGSYSVVFSMDAQENIMVVVERTYGSGGALSYNHVVPIETTDAVDTQTPDFVFATNIELTTVSGIAQAGATHAQSAHAPSDANNYVHPETHASSMITEDASHRFTTDAEKSVWNAKATSSDLATVSGIAQTGATHAGTAHAPSDANNYVHPTTAGSKHIPAAGASGQVLEYNSAGEAKWGRTITISTSDPSGGSDGDIWFKISS